MSAVLKGKVKFFDNEKGFGFIIPDGGGPDMFVHSTDIVGASQLLADARVLFETGKSEKGNKTKAINVRVI